MEREAVFTGYCRCMDDSRMVTVAEEQGALTEVDCDFRNCLYAEHCPIGKKIAAFLAE